MSEKEGSTWPDGSGMGMIENQDSERDNGERTRSGPITGLEEVLTRGSMTKLTRPRHFGKSGDLVPIYAVCPGASAGSVLWGVFYTSHRAITFVITLRVVFFFFRLIIFYWNCRVSIQLHFADRTHTHKHKQARVQTLTRCMKIKMRDSGSGTSRPSVDQ